MFSSARQFFAFSENMGTFQLAYRQKGDYRMALVNFALLPSASKLSRHLQVKISPNLRRIMAALVQDLTLLRV